MLDNVDNLMDRGSKYKVFKKVVGANASTLTSPLNIHYLVTYFEIEINEQLFSSKLI